jgi:hypothetical protein
MVEARPWRSSRISRRSSRRSGGHRHEQGRADRGELKIIDAWRNEECSGDDKLLNALSKRAEQYR